MQIPQNLFLCKRKNISDEVQTGGGPTGKMWCHEWFELPEVELFSLIQFLITFMNGCFGLQDVKLNTNILFHTIFHHTFAGSRYCHIQQKGNRNTLQNIKIDIFAHLLKISTKIP